MQHTPDLVPELLVRNLSDSLDFYCRLCGFHILYQRPAEGFAYLQRDSAELMLEQVGISRNFLDGTLDYPCGRGINFQLSVRDIDAVYRRFHCCPESLFLNMEEKWYATGDNETGVKQFVAQDPDGYLLRFSQRIGTRRRQEAVCLLPPFQAA